MVDLNTNASVITSNVMLPNTLIKRFAGGSGEGRWGEGMGSRW